MIRVNIKPLSSNDAWKGRRFMSGEYKAYKKALAFLLPAKIILPEPPFHIFLTWGLSNSLADWDNPIKPTQDCIATKYGFNDKLIRKGTVEIVKVPKGQEYFEFRIESLKQILRHDP